MNQKVNNLPDKVVLSLPMSACLLDRLEREVRTQQLHRPHQFVSRVGVIRQMIVDALDRLDDPPPTTGST